MGFFGTEFVDVRAELGAATSPGMFTLPHQAIEGWHREHPNGMTLYFAPGRYLLRRWMTTYTVWSGDYDFPEDSTLWMDDGAVLVFDSARIVIRGSIVAPMSKIFERVSRLDAPAFPSGSGMVLVASDLDAIYPEWWGAADGNRHGNHEAITAAIQTATVLRDPAVVAKTLDERGMVVIARDHPRSKPPIPVLFREIYEVEQEVQAGDALRRINTDELPVGASREAEDFGQHGAVTAILRGIRRGGREPSAGLRYVGTPGRLRILANLPQATPSQPVGEIVSVLHLINSYGASVEDLVIDGNGRATVGIFIEPTPAVPVMHSVLVRRCTLKNSTGCQLQVGPPAYRATQKGTVRIAVKEEADLDLGGAWHERKINIRVPFVETQEADGGMDVLGLLIDQCTVVCASGDSLGIQLRASNGVATRIADCRFQGTASAFIDAVGTMTLIDRCDFANRHFERRPVTQIIADAPGLGDTDAGPLGFELPEGQDVYLSTDPFFFRMRPGTKSVIRDSSGSAKRSAIEGVVALYACVSRSPAMFGTVRPGPLDQKRSERTSMMLGCVHRPDWRGLTGRWSARLSNELPPSVSWGRKGYSKYRMTMSGVSPGYNPDPCFTCVGSYLELGMDVYYGAPQCAVVGSSVAWSNQGRNRRPRARQARPGVRAVTFIFGLALALLMGLGGIGCAQRPPAPADVSVNAAFDAMDVTIDATLDEQVPSDKGIDAAPAIDDLVAPVDVSSSDVTDGWTDEEVPPLVVPGTVPIDGYPPPSQQRHMCPAPTDGEPGIAAPRLISPMSPLRMTSQRPTLRWELAPGLTGAQIELCRDPCCRQPITTIQASGSSVRPTTPLAPGVVFWRARGMVGSRVGREVSFTWEFGVPHRDSTIDTFKGPIHDFNGDGFDDVALVFGGHFRVYWGGRGGLTEERYTDHRLVSYEIARLAVSDVNADGFADVVAVSEVARRLGLGSYAQIEVFIGTSSGLVAQRPDHLATPWPVSLGDVNGDGFVDIVGSRFRDTFSTDTRYGMVLFSGLGGVGSGGMMRFPNPQGAVRITVFPGGGSVGDANGDGYGDLLVGDANANEYRGIAYGYLGGPSGPPLVPSVTIPRLASLPGSRSWGIASWNIGDVNHDGLADFHLVTQGGYLPVYFGSRERNWVYGTSIETLGRADSVQTFPGPGSDLDNDGQIDAYWGCTVCVVYPEDAGLQVWAGGVLVAGDFQSGAHIVRVIGPPPPVDHQVTRGFGDGAVAVDLDGDGFDDLTTVDPEITEFLIPRGRITVVFGGNDFGRRFLHLFVRRSGMPGRYGAMGLT